MAARYSNFGEKLTQKSGIYQLMQDLDQALNLDQSMLFLGGGNPAHIAEVSEAFRSQAAQLVEDQQRWQSVAGVYDSPQGAASFLQTLAEFFQRNFDLPITEKNISLTNGSQNSFFLLFNLFAGQGQGQVLLPMVPEYIGYADVGIEENLFKSYQPRIELLEGQLFKYHVDFEKINWQEQFALCCVSRPTNPTGNLYSDETILSLAEKTGQHGIPLMIDNAYGNPFPSVVFDKASFIWHENIIQVLSLSKLGLPGSRCGIVIANEEITTALKKMNAIMNLATGSFGPAIAQPMFASDDILRISQNIIKPFYQQKSEQANAWAREFFQGHEAVRIHKSEGAFFLWFWFKGLKIPTKELYQHLKARKVLVVPGEYYYPGLAEDWHHRHECIRVSFSQDEHTVKEGIKIISEEVLKNL